MVKSLLVVIGRVKKGSYLKFQPELSELPNSGYFWNNFGNVKVWYNLLTL